MRRVTHTTLILLAALPLTACPGKVEHKYGVAGEQKPAAVGEDDPRVVKDGDDLYPAKVVERSEAKKRPEQPSPGRGSGTPDESNGKCRLYAPKLASPVCCEPEFGFDVDTAMKACNVDVYLGESWHNTCGYYFHKPDGHSTWFRTSFLNLESAESAAAGQARQLREKAGATDLEVRKVPGATDAYWMTHDGLGWAYVGGWPAIRQFAWRVDSCADDGVAQIIAKIEAAKPPPKGAERLSLIPRARG